MPDKQIIDAPADDDIIDLLEVVKPGKIPSPSSTDSDDIDFSSDLDSMLAELVKHEDAAAGAFPDPTPVDHVVDPNEKLDMPSMQDLDNLLETLGAKPHEADIYETHLKQADAADTGDDLDAANIEQVKAEQKNTLSPMTQPSSDARNIEEMTSQNTVEKTVGTIPVPNIPASLDTLPFAETSAGATFETAQTIATDPFEAALQQAKAQADSTEAAQEKAIMPEENTIQLDTLPEPLPEPLQAPQPAAIADPFEAAVQQAKAQADSTEAAQEKAIVPEENVIQLDTLPESLPEPLQTPQPAAMADPFEAAVQQAKAQADSAEAAQEKAIMPEENTIQLDTLPEPLPEPLQTSQPTAIADPFEAAVQQAKAQANSAEAAQEKAIVPEENAIQLDTLPESLPEPLQTPLQTPQPAATTSAEKIEAKPLTENGDKKISAEPRAMEEVDINELDALLDDMLASAPPAGNLAPPEQPAHFPSFIDSDAFHQLMRRLEALEAHIDRNINPLEATHALVAEIQENQEQSITAATMPLKNAIDNAEHLQNAFHQATTAQIQEIQLKLSTGEQNNAAIAALHENMALNGSLLDEIKERLDSLESDMAKAVAASDEKDVIIATLKERFESLENSVEQAAASAAAKVIREEIAALLAT